MNKIHTVKEAASLLGVSIRRVQAMCKSGILESYKFAGTWAIPEKSIQNRLRQK